MVGVNGAPPQPAPGELGYLLARSADDYAGCVRELLGMSLWLPMRGAPRQLVVRQQADRRLVRAYTSPERLPATGGARDDAVVRRFADLIRQWRDDQIGLVVNPDSDSELQLPVSVFPQLIEFLEQTPAAVAAGEPPVESRRTVPAIDPPRAIGTVRFAALYDGVDPAGRPVIAPERPRVTDPDEQRRIVGYLHGGVVLQGAAGLLDDVYDQAKPDAVPANTRTDGEWVWQDGLAYYLETYGLGPEPEFYRAIVERGYRCPEPSEAQLRLARRALQEHQRISADLYQRWRSDSGT